MVGCNCEPERTFRVEQPTKSRRRESAPGLQPRRAALLGYVSVTMPVQNCWPLPVSTSYLRTNESLPSLAMR